MIRTKYRWLAFEIISDRRLDEKQVVMAIKRKIYELFGTFGDVKFKLEEYDSEKNFGIVRCQRDDLRRLRIALGLLREIAGVKVIINDIYCSGTLRKLKEELNKRRLFIDTIQEMTGGS